VEAVSGQERRLFQVTGLGYRYGFGNGFSYQSRGLHPNLNT
jgi:hypothetical protein